ncbi:hypothetical protein [Burkholderia sp. SIMBA_062]|uniref:hypothetical protein n=1 Tax=Burkholderia sp. SIMBA_062 TaxID=3085803 RepID=UPI003979AA2A
MSYQTTAQAPTDEEIEALARAREPQVWALDPPDFSSAQYRRASIEHAEDVLLEKRGLPPVRTYE